MEEKLNLVNLVWHKFMEGSLPPADVDVIAYSKKWIHPYYNPEGIRIGFMEEDIFYSAQWGGDDYSTHCSEDNDYYNHNGKDELPEYWIEIPKFTFK